jgi:hypothetical protein
MTTYPRKRPVRRSEMPRGPVQPEGLQEVRDSLLPLHDAQTVEPDPQPRGGEVPDELLALVKHHSRAITMYLGRAQSVGSLHQGSVTEWRRLVLYALTDALAHNHLLVGTIAAYLQREGLDPDLLRRYLQCPNPDRYISREAVQHLNGLTCAHPEEPLEPTWTHVGRRIARELR